LVKISAGNRKNVICCFRTKRSGDGVSAGTEAL